MNKLKSLGDPTLGLAQTPFPSGLKKAGPKANFKSTSDSYEGKAFKEEWKPDFSGLAAVKPPTSKQIYSKTTSPRQVIPYSAIESSTSKGPKGLKKILSSLKSIKNNLGLISVGALAGVAGVGLPAGLAMGAVKTALVGNLGLGLALGGGAVLAGTVLGLGAFIGAAMSTDGGQTCGLKSYVAAGLVSTLTAAALIF